jgi:hypothetical protein
LPLKCVPEEVKEQILKTSKAPYILYHGSDAAADICLTGFDIDRAGKHDPGDFGKGIYLHTSKHFSKMYGKNVFEVVADLKNPLVLDFERRRDEAYKKLDELEKKYGSPVVGYSWEFASLEAGKPLEHEEFKEALEKKARELGVETHQVQHKVRVDAAKRWRDELLKQGYDGVVAHGYEGKSSTTVVAFKEDSIALADCIPRESRECALCDWDPK